MSNHNSVCHNIIQLTRYVGGTTILRGSLDCPNKKIMVAALVESFVNLIEQNNPEFFNSVPTPEVLANYASRIYCVDFGNIRDFHFKFFAHSEVFFSLNTDHFASAKRSNYSYRLKKALKEVNWGDPLYPFTKKIFMEKLYINVGRSNPNDMLSDAEIKTLGFFGRNDDVKSFLDPRIIRSLLR